MLAALWPRGDHGRHITCCSACQCMYVCLNPTHDCLLASYLLATTVRMVVLCFLRWGGHCGGCRPAACPVFACRPPAALASSVEYVSHDQKCIALVVNHEFALCDCHATCLQCSCIFTSTGVPGKPSCGQLSEFHVWSHAAA